MSALRAFFIALQFLTRLPVRLRSAPSEQDIGRSLLYYPLVGLLIGLVLVGLMLVLDGLPELLRAALLVSLWVVLTGALHLDGLADSVDALVGGQGNREKTLGIMKDPSSGPMGVVALVLVLLLKFSALLSIPAQYWLLLLLAPVIARSAIVVLFITTPYVRPGGLGEALAGHAPRPAAWIVIVLVVSAIIATTGPRGILLLVAASVLFLLLRALFIRKIQGVTGDTAGAMIEVIETGVLICSVFSIWLH